VSPKAQNILLHNDGVCGGIHTKVGTCSYCETFE
jgi:hypothetical protein